MSSTNVSTSQSEYTFHAPEAPCSDALLTPSIIQICKTLDAKRVLDLGCGNGTMMVTLKQAGFQMSGCDPSESGIAYAQKALPDSNVKVLGVYDAPSKLGEDGFDVVFSTEVVEHLYSPRELPRFARQVLKPGGHLIVSTPYHGYLKNLLICLMNKWDWHHTALWDGMHVKFWSKNTLSQLLTEEGFVVERFIGVGRFRWLWMSMIIVARRAE